MPPRQTVAAIDGLYQWQGKLIGVQNAPTPGRVILMTLSSDGAAITRIQTLLSHHHTALDEPTTGAVADDAFYLLAATGVAPLRPARAAREPRHSCAIPDRAARPAALSSRAPPHAGRLR